MAFPSDHRYPGGLPAFFAAGHDFQHTGVAEDIAFERGEDRGRQIYTFNPQLVSVSTWLDQTQFDTLSSWYENDLLAGANRFDVQVAEQGGESVAWWASQFVGPFRWQISETGDRYEVTAELLLIDGPYATRTDPGLRGSMTMTSRLSARLVSDQLRGSMTMASTLTARFTPEPLRGSMTMASTLTAYLGVNNNDRLLEDGQQRIAESGEARVPE